MGVWSSCSPFLPCRLTLVGTGLVRDERVVAAMSRTGDKSELLRGPLFYVLVLFAVTLACWRNSPIGEGLGEAAQAVFNAEMGGGNPPQSEGGSLQHP